MNQNEIYRQRQAAILAAKVRGQNRVNEEANKYERELIEYFRRFVGRKIINNGGHLSARAKQFMPVKPPGLFRCWQNGGGYSLTFEADVTEQAGEHNCIYAKAYLYVGKIENHILVSVNDPQERRTDHTVEEVQSLRQALRDARDAMHEAQSKLGNFGEYDQ